MRITTRSAAAAIAFCCCISFATAQEKSQSEGWRALPLIKDGKVSDDWLHVGWGTFVVDDGSLRTECDEKGMGLLVYRREKIGECEIKVVYKTKDSKSNAGVYVRIDDGILTAEKPPAVHRDEKGKLSQDEIKKLMAASETEQGPWYAVHHGYEVQICEAADEFHRTGAIYGLAKAAAAPAKSPGEWRTMIITLSGSQVLVDLDGRRVSSFDSSGPLPTRERNWTEPKREPKRPNPGYIGLQNHDPGDVVHFEEVSVRPLEDR